MIREFNLKDINVINKLGINLSTNFIDTNKLEEYNNRDYELIFVYEDNDKVIGFIQIEKHYEVIDLINIIIDSEYRGMGKAKDLLDYVINNIEGKRILLEVNETNEKAIKFYKKNNFREINRRKKYYGTNDAIILERSI